MSILVTGGAGFIGSHFIERLLAADSNAAIVCLDNFSAAYDPRLKRANLAAFEHSPRVRIVEQSFCDASAMRRLFLEHGIERVVHLGACAGVRASVLEPLAFAETNVGGTLALLEAAKAHPVERFVLVSSSTVYGRDAARPFQEDAPLGVPLNPYGVTKLAAEYLGQVYHQLHRVPVVAVRPFSVYGPRVRPDLALGAFAAAICDGRSVQINGDGSIRRDFTHVSDVCVGLHAALETPGIDGQAFNLGHHQPVAIIDLLRQLESALGRPAIVEFAPENPSDMPISWADLSKSARCLGYHPKVDIAAGVEDFARWYLRERAG